MSATFYPAQWEQLDKTQILAGLPQYLDSNHLFHLAEWSLAKGHATDAYYYYLQAMGRGNAHLGVVARAFEYVFCESNYWLAEAIAEDARTRFPESPTTYFLLARVAATKADEIEFKKKLKEAEERGGAPEEVSNIKKFSSHFFLGV